MEDEGLRDAVARAAPGVSDRAVEIAVGAYIGTVRQGGGMVALLARFARELDEVSSPRRDRPALGSKRSRALFSNGGGGDGK